MELIWEKLVSDYYGNEDGHHSFYYGYELAFYDGKIVCVREKAWVPQNSAEVKTYIIFDSFDISNGERERLIYTIQNFINIENSLEYSLQSTEDGLCLTYHVYNQRLDEPKGTYKYSKKLYYKHYQITETDYIGEIEPRKSVQEIIFTIGNYELFEREYYIVCRYADTHEEVWRKRHGV